MTSPSPIAFPPAMEWEGALRALDNTIKDEGIRRLKLQIVLLQDANDELKWKLDEATQTSTQQQRKLRDADLLQSQSLNAQMATKSAILDLKSQLVAERKISAHCKQTHNVISDREELLRKEMKDIQKVRDSDRRVANATLKATQGQLTSLEAREQDYVKQLDNLRSNLASVEEEFQRYRGNPAIVHLPNASRRKNNKAAQLKQPETVTEPFRDGKVIFTEEQTALSEARQALKDIRELYKVQTEAHAVKSTNYETQIKTLQADLHTAEQQLDACRIELAHTRTSANSSPNSIQKRGEVGIQPKLLQKQLESALYDLKNCQNELAGEVCTANQARAELLRSLAASRNREGDLESKIELLKTKMQSLKEQLKQSRSENAELHNARNKKSNKDQYQKHSGPAAGHCVKTPDGAVARGKKLTIRDRLEQNAMGEKSMFSITPFLNRTANITTGPGNVNKQQSEGIESMPGDDPSSSKDEGSSGVVGTLKLPSVSVSMPLITEKSALQPPQPLDEIGLSLQNGKVPLKRLQTKRKKITPVALENLEEAEDENEVSCSDVASNGLKQPVSSKGMEFLHKVPNPTDVKKVKRRRLATTSKTLFDNEEGEDTKKLALEAVTGMPRLLQGNSLTMKNGLKPALSNPEGFGSFSPLKKHKRGVHASFLG